MRNSSLVEWFCAEDVTGLSVQPKLRLLEVGSQRSEVRKAVTGMIQGYRDLAIYKESYRLLLRVYEMTKQYPAEERYELTSQMRRSAMSIPLNIAEGYGRKSSSIEFKRFLTMAMGSVNEMEVLTDISRDAGYIDAGEHERLLQEYQALGKQIHATIQKWR